MPRYFAARTGQALFVLFASFTASFLLLQALPGDAILIRYDGLESGFTAQQIAEIRLQHGVDAPVWVQYLTTLRNFLTGNFGYSIHAGVPVSDLLRANIGHTLQLASLAMLVAVPAALLIAFLATLAPFAWLRGALASLPLLFTAVPVFWLGIMMIQLFSFRLGLVPIINPTPLQSLVLPVATLALPMAAPLAQVLIRSLDEIQTRPFVGVARAKGASRSRVLWRHVLRNAVLPVLTITGILFGELLAGSMVTESVFGRNGLGRITEQAVANQDTAVLQAVVVIAAAAFTFINLAVDMLYPLLDPRLARRKAAA